MLIFFFLRFYLFDRERHSERGNTSRKVGEGEADSPLSREPNVGSLTPGLWHHDLSGRQRLKRLSHPGAPGLQDLEE